MKVVFIGASQFGLRCLQTILVLPQIKVVGVLTAPRVFRISYSKGKPVENVLYADFSAECQNHSLPCYEIEAGMNDRAVYEMIRGWQPEFILVVGWYHMIPQAILKLPGKGVAGMHASLLPQYRGGAPLVWAILNGEKEVGISLFYFDDGVDTGDIIGQKTVPVKLNDTIATVYHRIEDKGIELLEQILPALAADKVARKPQCFSGKETALVWPQRSPEDGKINWATPAWDIYNFVRAQTKPYPGAFTTFKGEKLTIWEAKLFDWMPYKGEPGEIVALVDEGSLRGMLVATLDGDSPLLITKLRSRDNDLTGLEYAESQHITTGTVLGGRTDRD